MNNSEVRAWYLRKVSEIPNLDKEWVRRGDSIDKRARQAWQHMMKGRGGMKRSTVAPAKALYLDECLQSDVHWSSTGDALRPWRARIGRDTWTVRINDFPEHPLYTLLIDDRSAGDFDDWPPRWLRTESPVVPLPELERRAILQALEKSKGNRALAASLLGIARTKLGRKLKEYQLAS